MNNNMKYDPIMCMMVPDSVSTKDANKNEGFKIHKAEIRGDKLYLTYTDLLYGGKETESFTKSEAKGFLKDPWNTWEGNTKSVMMSFVKDSNTLDKAIKSCDATSISSAKSGLKSKIDNWYRNAKIDYGVSGKFIDVREESGALVVYWEEDGKRKKYSFGKYWDDYSVDQLYNIWMEQAD